MRPLRRRQTTSVQVCLTAAQAHLPDLCSLFRLRRHRPTSQVGCPAATESSAFLQAARVHQDLLDQLQTAAQQPVVVVSTQLSELVPSAPYPDLAEQAPGLPPGRCSIHPGSPAWFTHPVARLGSFAAFQTADPCLAKPGRPATLLTRCCAPCTASWATWRQLCACRPPSAWPWLCGQPWWCSTCAPRRRQTRDSRPCSRCGLLLLLLELQLA